MELGAELIGMHDSGRLVGGDSDEFEEVAEEVGPITSSRSSTSYSYSTYLRAFSQAWMIAASLMPCY